jgi:predicted aminopeptidase
MFGAVGALARRAVHVLRTRRGATYAALLIVGIASGLGACTTVGYYSQSIGGHLDVLRAARPIDDWLVDPATPEALRMRLEKVRAMRRFAAHDLGLPDNRSYTTYADLKRPYVVWSVFATPELSLRLRTWCFPIVGCVSYRGYYSKDDADAFAKTLKENGDDVYVGGIPAYSTLGYTTDPILSTFIGFPEGEVARLIFHELAHQVVYLSGDTTFNESFAVAVEEEGVKRWFAFEAQQKGANAEAASGAYRLTVDRKRDFVALLTRHRTDLQEAYAREISDAAKRTAKAAEFTALHADYEAMKRDPASSLHDYNGYDRYFAQALNNANLAAVATYTQRVPAFAKLLDQEGGDLPKFYMAVAELAELPTVERNAKLDALAGQGGMRTGLQVSSTEDLQNTH